MSSPICHPSARSARVGSVKPCEPAPFATIPTRRDLRRSRRFWNRLTFQSRQRDRMKIVFFGLSITSSWGNGHATTYRALLKALHGRGHRIVFFEKDTYWYADNRDLPRPDFCDVHIFRTWKNALAKVKLE